MSKLPTSTLKSLLTPASTEHRQHPTIGCQQYDLEVDDVRRREFHVYTGEALRDAYVDREYLVVIVEREGFSGAAKYLRDEKFPSENNAKVRTGDFGEVVGHIVLQDVFEFKIPVPHLRGKRNKEQPAPGVDIIAFRLDDVNPDKDVVVFGEVKTSKTKSYGVAKVFEETEELLCERRQKMRAAVRFVSERLVEQKDYELERRISRFLDCYTNPQYVEAFFPFLVRDKRTWGEDALDGIVLDKLDPDRVVLCVFLIGDLEKAIRAAYEMAAKVRDEIG